jgi:hypothetical protein
LLDNWRDTLKSKREGNGTKKVIERIIIQSDSDDEDLTIEETSPTTNENHCLIESQQQKPKVQEK